MSDKYLIFSIEHNAWWCSNHQGYTDDIKLAGWYTEKDAKEILEVSNIIEFHECMIPVEMCGVNKHSKF